MEGQKILTIDPKIEVILKRLCKTQDEVMQAQLGVFSTYYFSELFFLKLINIKLFRMILF